MSRFDTYFLMNADDIIEYVKVKIDMFEKEAKLEVKEIGDGNLNYVYRVWDEKTGKSVIVKHAGIELRISKEFKISTDRNRIESEILMLVDKLAPGLVPKIYMYDTTMCACCMEDLTGYELMRYALMRGETFPLFADDITTYMVNTLLLTTDIVMGHKEKKALVKNYINPELCEITEDLVYTEPYADLRNRNNVFQPIADFVQKELYDDQELKLEVAKLKFDFLNNAQALLHGDLHTGSIFIKKDSTIIFDPEFAFYGPIGYDVGNVIANLFFAWCRSDAEFEPEKKESFCEWIHETVIKVIDMFVEKFNACYDKHVTEYMAKTPGFKEHYLDSILADTSGVTGLELNRRIVGIANVKDITTISDQNKRARAEKICITAAKDFIKNRANYKTGEQFWNCFMANVNKF